MRASAWTPGTRRPPRSDAASRAAKPRTGPDLEQEVVAQLASMEDIVVSEVCLDEAQARVDRADPARPARNRGGGFFRGRRGGGDGRHDRAEREPQRPREPVVHGPPPRPGAVLLLLREVLESWPESELSFDEDMAKLSVVGIGLRTHTGVGEKMFRALAEVGINVQLINTSEIRICAVVAGKHGPAALARLNREFGRS